MDDYIITVCNGQKEVPIKGVNVGEKVNLSGYEYRCIDPKEWQIFKHCFPKNIFDPEITYFLDMHFEIRIYKKSSPKMVKSQKCRLKQTS